jgi:archaellum biogenesis protein FlaJ (TadC family)
MVPPDEIWHLTGEKGELEETLGKVFKSSVLMCILLGSALFFAKYGLSIPFLDMVPFEIIFAISITPLIITGIKVFTEEGDISRKEMNFLGFLPALGSISSMRGGKINESIYYLSEKDYGVLSRHIKNLYRRLRTRINDDESWEWFGVDTGSNYIQRSSEMFREATYAAANPRKASRMIAENIRKIRDLRIKKMAIVNTSTALFAGVTFGISFAVYVSLVISEIDVGSLLITVPPGTYANLSIIIFTVFIIHSFIIAFTIKTLRGSHNLIVLLYFVPLVWIVAVTCAVVELGLSGYLVV